MRPDSSEDDKPILLVAAESIAAESGVGETVAGVLRTRALGHYGEALRQYVAIRLGDPELAQRAIAQVEEQVGQWGSQELTGAPGARAQLFRLAREMARAMGAQSDDPERWRALDWQPPPAGADTAYLQGLAALRGALSPQSAELLELRYARELNCEELAFVVNRPLEDVITQLESAAEEAQTQLGESPPSRLGGLRGALQEAFALARPPREREPRKKEKRPALPAGTIIGERYEIESRVGEGSFGDVYRALDTDVPGHVVALKLLHRQAHSEERRRNSLRELRLIASVFHPSVVDFKDHGWDDRRLWFVMPWYQGETLQERIRRAPLTRAEARDIFVPLAQALATIHEAGIRHQDIKPDNIFLARIGEAGGSETRILPVLIDLGVAAKEAEMIVAGTPLYFAPEIAAQYASKPARGVNAKADVFSLALALRNALEPSTREQVPGTAVEAFIRYRADHSPAPPTAKEFAFLAPHFSRWLSVDAAERPSAERFASELLILTEPERRRERRRATLRWTVPLALGSALAIGGVTHVYLQERLAAAQARSQFQNAREDLSQENARRLQLEAASAALKEDYAASLLTRDEMQDRLQVREQRHRKVRAHLNNAREESQKLEEQLQEARAGLERQRLELADRKRKQQQQQQQLAERETQLQRARDTEQRLSKELAESTTRLAQLEKQLNTTRDRTADLLGDLKQARVATHTEQQRASDLERELIKVQKERAQAQQELRELRKQLSKRTRDDEAAADAGDGQAQPRDVSPSGGSPSKVSPQSSEPEGR